MAALKLIDYTIRLKSYDDTITLIPFACVHRDNPGFVEHLFRECMNEGRDPNTYYIGVGDYEDFLRTHARTHIQSYNVDRDSFQPLDAMVRKDAKEFYEKYLRANKGKVIGLAEGNHHYEFTYGTTDTQYLCELLGCHYLGKPASIRLRVEVYGKVIQTFKILVHHGDWSSGYTRTGGDVNAAELKALGFDYDIYIFAHTHRKWGMHIPSITIPRVGDLKVMERQRAFIRAGCFMTGYHPDCMGKHSYASDRLLTPTELGYVKLKIKLTRPSKDQKTRTVKHTFVCEY